MRQTERTQSARKLTDVHTQQSKHSYEEFPTSAGDLLLIKFNISHFWVEDRPSKKSKQLQQPQNNISVGLRMIVFP